MQRIIFFKGNIWSADPTNMQLINKDNKGIRFLLCIIDIFMDCSF